MQKDFFQLKEVERLCSKEKGINSMSVKDVLMSLVHDGMVDTEKIGTCVYFWAFPNKATQKASWFVFRISRYCLQHKGTIQKLKEDIVATRARTARLKNALQEARTARQDTVSPTWNFTTIFMKRMNVAKCWMSWIPKGHHLMTSLPNCLIYVGWIPTVWGR